MSKRITFASLVAGICIVCIDGGTIALPIVLAKIEIDEQPHFIWNGKSGQYL